MEPEERGRDDFISGLPDDLLHGILLRLRSLPAAARTSVLSRRWRRVWANLPELVLDSFHVPGRPPSSFLRAVDGALAAYSASNDDVSVLTITVPSKPADGGFYVPARHAAPWLRFASRRVSGTLSVSLPFFVYTDDHELELPPCWRATEITLCLGAFVLRLRPAGLFAALTDLTIESAKMEGRELGAFVSSMCPLLRNLTLRLNFALTGGSYDVSIRSASLRRLQFHVKNIRRLEVIAPMLQVFIASPLVEAHVSAPKLAEAEVDCQHRQWHYVADDVPRRLRRLDITKTYVNETPSRRMRRFDAVDELRLCTYIQMNGYNSFLDDANNLPMCDTLSVTIGSYHGLVPIMLHLLRRRHSMRKLVVRDGVSKVKMPCPLVCPCRLPNNHRTDNITLGSLEEIEINQFNGSDEQLEFLKLLVSRCSATRIISVELNKGDFAPPPNEEITEKNFSICRPNFRVRSYASVGRSYTCTELCDVYS